MEEKILLNALKNTNNQKLSTAAPDKDYIKAMETLGLITTGWDTSLTSLGSSFMGYLDNKLNPW